MKKAQISIKLTCVFAFCLSLFTACGPKIPTEFAPVVEQSFDSSTTTLTVNGTVDLPDESYVCVTLSGSGEFVEMAVENINGVSTMLAETVQQAMAEMPNSSTNYIKVMDGAFSTTFTIAEMQIDRYEIIVTLPFGIAEAPQPINVLKALGANGEKLTMGTEGISVPTDEVNGYFVQTVFPQIEAEFQGQIKNFEDMLDSNLSVTNEQLSGYGLEGVYMSFDRERRILTLSLTDHVVQFLSQDESSKQLFGDQLALVISPLDAVFEAAYGIPAELVILDESENILATITTANGCVWNS